MKIENIKYQSFIEFVNDVLLPNGSLYSKLHGFVYRGERTNGYKLLPGALREDNLDLLYGAGKPIGNQSQWLWWQIHAEYSLIREFYKTANYNGLKIPKVDAIAKNYNDIFPTELMHCKGTYKWITDEIADLAALAQHYGVLTRLIDWSYDLYVALYFASMGAIKAYDAKRIKQDDTMVIWALNAYHIQFLQPTISRIPINFVVPPYYDNPNLNAQKGVLSYWEIDAPGEFEQIDNLQHGIVRLTDRTSLDELIQQYCDDYPGKNEHLVLLYKIEIPVQECVEVYDYLCRLGYAAARLFPGYDGVVREIKENEIYQKVKNTLSNTNLTQNV